MSLTAAEIHGVLSEAFPAKAERASLDYVETVTRPTGGFAVVVRLVFDPHGSSIERLSAYATAFIHVASCALANAGTVETLMPHDLFISNVLKLSRAETYVDFVKALSVKSRLGKYLPATSRLPLSNAGGAAPARSADEPCSGSFWSRHRQAPMLASLYGRGSEEAPRHVSGRR